MSSTVLTDVEWQNDDAEDAVLQCILVRTLLGAPTSGSGSGAVSTADTYGHFVTHAIKQRMVDFIRANIVPSTKRLRERVLICDNEPFASTATLRSLNSIGCAFTDIIRTAWVNTVRWGQDVDAAAIRSRPVTMEAVQRMATRMELISRQPLDDIAALEDGIGNRTLDALRAAAMTDEQLTEESLSRRAPAELTTEDGALLSQITGGIRATSILEDDVDGCKDLALPPHLQAPTLSPYVSTPPPPSSPLLRPAPQSYRGDGNSRAQINTTVEETGSGDFGETIGDGYTSRAPQARPAPDAAGARSISTAFPAPTVPRIPTISATSLASLHMTTPRGGADMRMGEMEKETEFACDIDRSSRVRSSPYGVGRDEADDGRTKAQNGGNGGVRLDDDYGDEYDDDTDSLFGSRMFGLPSIPIKALSGST